MTEKPAAITKVEELVETLDLARFHTYELVATARDKYEEVEPDAEIVEPGSELVRVRTGIRQRERALDYRVELSVQHAYGQLVADMAAVYESDVPLELTVESAAAVIEFGDRVAMMALYPYLRQAISDLGQRVWVDMTLPMLRPGNLTFAPSTDEATDRDDTADRKEGFDGGGEA